VDADAGGAWFEEAPVAQLVVDASGAVLATNAAARTLLPAAGERPTTVQDLLGPPGLPLLRGAAELPQRGPWLALATGPGAGHWVEPWVRRLPPTAGGATDRFHLVLHDVTPWHRRLEDLHLYARAMLDAQEGERRRLAQEIHDDTVQELIVLCRRLDELAERSGAPLAEELHAVRAAAAGIADRLRGFARGLRPSVLDDLGLVAGLRHLVRELEERSGLRAGFAVFGESRRLEPDAELGIFRIGQEALRNVERHASAARVALRLRFFPDRTRLLVADDGRGFAALHPDEWARRGHLGLLGMRERARLIGGTLRLRSRPGRGTALAVDVPAL
jgi:two-component system sensor histidine kinase UhpB